MAASADELIWNLLCHAMQASLDEAFFEALKKYTASNPMRLEAHWTNLTG